jgi:hypothetical protein
LDGGGRGVWLVAGAGGLRPWSSWDDLLWGFAVLTGASVRSMNWSEAKTRAVRVPSLQQALALGFCEAVGRSVRGAPL